MVDNYYNVLDLGSSRLRFSVFDSKLNEKFSETKILRINDPNLNQFLEIKNIIKNAEKKIEAYIDDIILILDKKNLLCIDISLKKKLDHKSKIDKIYDSLNLELKHLIYSYYKNYEITHIILNKCIADGVQFEELPIEKKEVSELKIDFKIICFPRKTLDELRANFSKINLNVICVYCNSYVKSQSYIKKLNLEKISFLEIGYERTSLIIYEKNKLKLIQTIPIGSSHITKDISKVFKITYEDAEKIKYSFNKSDTEFSYKDANEHTKISVKDIISKNISISLLKKVILYRIQEIIDINFKISNVQNLNINLKETDLFLIGGGSILFDNNSFYLNDEFEFKSINFFCETDNQICLSGLSHYFHSYKTPNISGKNKGLFEKFFFYFSK